MNERILLGVDPGLSPATQHAIHVVGDLVKQAALPVHLVLLNVISLTNMVAAHPGYYMDQVVPISPSPRQYNEAEEVLYKARLILQQQGIRLEQSEAIVRIGTPAEEIVKVAHEEHVNFIIVGSRGNAWKQRMRRCVLGSISRRVLQVAPCPVMIVTPPPFPQANDPVAWYEYAIKQYLSKHTDTLSVFTPKMVSQQFPSPASKRTEQQEIAAAARALEKLAHTGKLCRREMDGSVCYFND